MTPIALMDARADELEPDRSGIFRRAIDEVRLRRLVLHVTAQAVAERGHPIPPEIEAEMPAIHAEVDLLSGRWNDQPWPIDGIRKWAAAEAESYPQDLRPGILLREVERLAGWITQLEAEMRTPPAEKVASTIGQARTLDLRTPGEPEPGSPA